MAECKEPECSLSGAGWDFGHGTERTESLAEGSQQKERGDLCDIGLGMYLMVSGCMACFKSSYIDVNRKLKVKEN